MALSVANFNLGVFAQMLVFGVCLGFYGQPEDRFYVWIHNADARGFLRQKMLTAGRYATLLTLPIVVVLSVFYPQNILILLGFQLLGYLYLLLMIVAKYAAYPQSIDLPQSFMIAACFLFPPLLLVLIPLYYGKAVRGLQLILG